LLAACPSCVSACACFAFSIASFTSFGM
jgi:hypothetical protein